MRVDSTSRILTRRRLQALQVRELAFSTYEIENLSIIPLLFQTGYLTIKSTWVGPTGQAYDLGYPNYEVEQAFEQHLLADYLEPSAGQMSAILRSA